MNIIQTHINRASRAARLFELEEAAPACVNDTGVGGGNDLETIMKQLERLLSKELRTWWDYTTLNSYLEKEIIPRGLRMNKAATTIYSDVFTQEWNAILSSCSINLMK